MEKKGFSYTPTTEGIVVEPHSVQDIPGSKSTPTQIKSVVFRMDKSKNSTVYDYVADETGHKSETKRNFRLGRFLLKTAGVLLVFLLSAAVLLYGATAVICLGPFPTARQLFVVSATETSAVKFLATLHLSEEEVAEILRQNAVLSTPEVTNTALPFAPPASDLPTQDIELLDITGSTYKGKLMVVQDPSRVRLACLDNFGPNVSGKKVSEFVAESGAVAGVNAGGFVDEGGVGKGGQPLGLLIKDGEIRAGSPALACSVVGLTWQHQLVVGDMTGAEALKLGVRDAVHFGPTFIVNGKPVEVSGYGSGINPRTVIGQRADGVILLLVIDGRQAHSIGATYQDCIDVMLEHGAVNAANLDGGSSSIMEYEGKTVNVCSSLYGPRNQPAAFVVV